MNPSHPQKLVKLSLPVWIKVQCSRLGLRSGASLRQLRKQAKRADEYKQDDKMREYIQAGELIAEHIRKSPRSFAANWKDLAKYELTVFNLTGAEETVRRAVALKLPDANGLQANVPAIAERTASWRDVIEQARRSLLEGPSQGDSLVIYMPSAMLGVDNARQKYRRYGLQFVYGNIFAACREAGIPFEVRARLFSGHDQLDVEKHRKYISYHSISAGPGDLGMHIKETEDPTGFSFDRGGYSGWSAFGKIPLEDLALDEISTEEAERFFRECQERLIAKNSSKYAQSAEDEKEPLPERYVFLGLQVIGDSVQALARLPMLTMLEEVAATCRERNIPLIVKRHPLCSSKKVEEALKEGVKNQAFKLSTASIHRLIAGSCATCVVNSGVGAEALLHEKPVYVFGASDYQQACYRISKRGEFREIFQPDKPAVPVETLMKFCYRLKKQFATNFAEPEEAKAFIAEQVRKHALG
jgi:Capsule polysaccharide biosynthesis protein